MARIAAILKATATATWRERRSILSFGANNFFVTIVFFFREYLVGQLFYGLLAVVMLVPLSSDPLHRIPRERLATWPLSRGDRVLLRVLAPWLNPITWLIAGFTIWSAARHDLTSAMTAVSVLVLVIAIGALLPAGGRSSFWRIVPSFPTSLGQLMRKDLRQVLCTLDFWLAAILSLSFASVQISHGSLPPEAQTIFSILIVLALSTVSQTLFGLDGPAGITRYRLLPVSGWRIAASKSAVFLLIAIVLTSPASLRSGVAAAAVSLAFGLWSSVRPRAWQPRWRFAASPSGRNSVLLVLASIAAGVVAFRVTVWIVVPCFALAVASVLFSGRRFDRASA